MWWKCQYSKSSSDHGTLAFFRNKLNRIAVTKEPKKDVNACIDLIYAVVKGHFLACACDLFGASSLDQQLILPPGIYTARKPEQLAFITKMARMVVDRCSIIDGAFTGEEVCDAGDGVYNYARILCHFGSLVMEFRDAWAEGDGDRVLRCWKLFLPHFKTAGCTKYSLEALRLMMQTNAVLSPNLAHQVTWNRFVNVRGGAGNNIPCDLYNEHVNKELKKLIQNMGSNVTESALQRAARCVTTLHQVCRNFDVQSGVACRTTAHSTKSDSADVNKVVSIVLKNKLLVNMSAREHRSFPGLVSNPLHKWDVKKTLQWVKEKKREHLKHLGKCRAEVTESEIEITDLEFLNIDIDDFFDI